MRHRRGGSLLREGRVLIEHLALRATTEKIRAEAPRGNGEPVMVVPGFATDDGWTTRLRNFLTTIGYNAVGWGLGRNRGNVPKLIPAMIQQTERLEKDCGHPVRLIGWSLGGYLAREVAREQPGIVERVVTLGAPIVGGPSYTATASRYVRKGYDLKEIREGVLEREC